MYADNQGTLLDRFTKINKYDDDDDVLPLSTECPIPTIVLWERRCTKQVKRVYMYFEMKRGIKIHKE